MKIVKPLTLGVLHRPYRYRGRHRLAIAALGFFRLGQPGGDRFLTENLQWGKIAPILPAGVPLDHVMPKARAEVMLSGSAHAEGEPVSAMQVRLQCGPIDKRLRVLGPRNWRRRCGTWLCVDAAQPFAAMPLIWENAYGGADYAANPLGRGYQTRRQRLGQRSGAMPTVEPIDAPARPGCRHHLPACFAPMSLLHAPQRLRSGTYDQRWLREDFPGLPRDFDFGVYNLAPADQQFVGSWRGDEAYALEGVHPQQAVLAGQLPGLAARAFILRRDKAPADLEEVALACDTVWFFPDQEIGLLVFRGETEIDDSDALDVASLMVAYEQHDAVARPLDHYREIMGLRLDAHTAGLHAFNEAQLAPPRTPAQVAARAAARAQQAEALRQRNQQLLDERMAELWQQSGLTPPPDYVSPQAPAPLLNGPTPDEIAAGEFELAELHAQAEALAAQAKAASAARIAAAQALTPPAATPGGAAAARTALERAQHVAADLLGAAATPSAAVSDMLAGSGLEAAQQQDVHTALAQQPAQRRAARNAAAAPELATALPDAAALALRRLVEQCLRDGTPLAGRDLAGANLHNMDLRGCDLREVQLERADLRNARLDGADLRKATLTAADLSGADFSGANLDGANLGATQAQGARFCRASLRDVRAGDADWREADLQGAQFERFIATGIRLDGARLDDAVLESCILNDARAPASLWRNARWRSTVATGIDLSDAKFDGAVVERSVLMDATLRNSGWRGARLNSIYAGGKADWSGADLRDAQLSRCHLHGAALIGADLSGGTFAQSDFGTADLSDARCEDARFYRSLFMNSRLHRLGAQRADFFQALLRKADFSDAQLPHANLLQADAAEAIWLGAQLGGATLARKAELS